MKASASSSVAPSTSPSCIMSAPRARRMTLRCCRKRFGGRATSIASDAPGSSRSTAAERAVAIAREARLDDLHSEALSALAAVHRGRGTSRMPTWCSRARCAWLTTSASADASSRTLAALRPKRHDLEAAQQRFVESYGCFRRAGDRRGEAVALNHYGRVLLEAGNASQAARVLAQTIAIARELEDEELVALATLNVAATLYVDGDLTMAERRASEALGYFNHTPGCRAPDRMSAPARRHYRQGAGAGDGRAVLRARHAARAAHWGAQGADGSRRVPDEGAALTARALKGAKALEALKADQLPSGSAFPSRSPGYLTRR